jgi:hypothetical protein
MSLSACLLTRNEEKSLPRALRSVAGIAGELIVVDTGSSDGTVRVAMEHGARVYRWAWDDDFAAGCNHALSQATGDWILWINPDEELAADSRPYLLPYTARDEVLAYSVRVRELLRAGQPDAFTETLQVRLFRRHLALRNVGRLHPHFDVSLRELAQSQGQEVATSEVLIIRHAYQSVLTEAKLRWALRLLELELRDRPGQLHYLIEYGLTLLRLSDAMGHEVLAEAVEKLRPLGESPVAPVPTVGPLLEYLLTVSPGQCRSCMTRAEADELAQRWFPNSPPLLWRRAEYSFRAGDYRTAAAFLERLVDLGQNQSYDRSAAFDPRIIGDSARMNLGICYLRLGHLTGAELCFRHLLGHKSYHEQASQNLALAENLRRQGQNP